MAVAKQNEKKRSALDEALDDVADGIRQILEDLDRMLNPDKQRQRTRVPAPVRIEPDRPNDRNPYPFR